MNEDKEAIIIDCTLKNSIMVKTTINVIATKSKNLSRIIMGKVLDLLIPYFSLIIWDFKETLKPTCWFHSWRIGTEHTIEYHYHNRQRNKK